MNKITTVLVATVMGMVLAPATVRAQTVYPTGLTIWEPGTYDGYTMFVGGDGVGYLLRMDGKVVNTWSSPIEGEFISAIEALPDGHVLCFSYPFPASKDQIFELDFHGNVVWEAAVPAGYPAGTSFHHDSERLPNGNTLILCRQPITVPSISPNQIRDDFIIELDPSGNVVWEWYTWEHFDEFGYTAEAAQLISAKAGDWAHANSISVIPPNNHTDPALAEGNIIVSQRSTNTIFIIDRATGDVGWRMGPDNHETFGQHTPYMIPQGLPGAGNIMVFDNGSGVGYPLLRNAPGFSQVHEIDPVTSSFVWSYNAQQSGLIKFSFFSNIVGIGERLPNGNALITSGAKGRIFEVTSTGELVWEYMSPFKNISGGSESLVVFRAYRLPYSWAPLASEVMRR
jgi:hypothetical protein